MRDLYQFDEIWERDDPEFKEELMMISLNINPYSNKRMITRNVVNWQSRNSRYTYRRVIKDNTTWTIGVYPNEMDAETYYDDPIYDFEVKMPGEFLDLDVFMSLNTGFTITEDKEKYHYYW